MFDSQKEIDPRQKLAGAKIQKNKKEIPNIK